MRIEYRTYPAQRKVAINDRQHTKRYGERVRIPAEGGRWKWASFIEVLNADLAHLLSVQEQFNAGFAKAISDTMMFGLPQAEATHFRGLSGTGIDVRVAKPTAYFRKIKK